MTDIVDRIAEVIWAELREQDCYADPEMGMIDSSGGSVNMHEVAAAVARDLKLRPEWTVRQDGYFTGEYYERELTHHDGGADPVFVRYSTEWVADE